MASKQQEKFYDSILKVLTDECASKCLDTGAERNEVAEIVARRLGQGDIQFYNRVLSIFEDSCSSYCLDDELDRVRTARAIAKEW